MNTKSIINDELIVEVFDTPVLMYANIKTNDGTAVAAIYNNESAKEQLKGIYEQLKACNGQSLSNIELATAHREACVNWESTMMKLVGYDSPASVETAIKTRELLLKLHQSTADEIKSILGVQTSVVSEIRKLKARNNELEEAIKKVNKAFPKAFELSEEQTAALAVANKTMHKTTP